MQTQPITTGSPKQIAWAEDIRRDALRLRAFAEAEIGSGAALPRYSILVPAVLAAIRWDNLDARYWIEARRYVQFLPYDLDQAEAHQDIAAASLLKRLSHLVSDRGFQAFSGLSDASAADLLRRCNKAS